MDPELGVGAQRAALVQLELEGCCALTLRLPLPGQISEPAGAIDARRKSAPYLRGVVLVGGDLVERWLHALLVFLGPAPLVGVRLRVGRIVVERDVRIG